MTRSLASRIPPAADGALAPVDIATVIQGLFELGMDVAAICGRFTDPQVVDRLQAALDDVDRAVRELRAASFAARHTA